MKQRSENMAHSDHSSEHHSLSLQDLVGLPDLTSERYIHSSEHESLFALWTARLFVYPPFFRSLANKRRGRYGSIDLTVPFQMMGFEQVEDNDVDDDKRLEFFKKAQLLIQNLERKNPVFNGVFNRNINQLADLIGLSNIDTQLLGFFCLHKGNQLFSEFTDHLSELNRQQLVDVVAHILKQPSSEISYAIGRHNKLLQAGLIKLDWRTDNELSRKIEVLDGLSDALSSQNSNPLELLEPFFFKSEPAGLTLSDFPHMKNESDAIVRYLQAAPHQAGQNILVHGEPGTGKTQWVKALVQTLGHHLYEISAEDEEGAAMMKERRVAVYRLAQSALANQGGSVVLFDEVEDVFPTDQGMFAPRSRVLSNKAWINKLLEQNAVPTFWVSNQVRHIDPAYIRRFDLVIEISTPPKSVRLAIISQLLDGLNLRPQWIEQLSEKSQLVPAVIERAAKVIHAIQQPNVDPQWVEKQLLNFVNNTLQAQGKRPIKLKNVHNQLPYSLEYINADADIPQLLEGLKHGQAGRFCLYGLPGTGKTALGHYIAKMLDKPLIIKRASDLLSPYVGEAEQNIAAAFEQATRDDAVLQIDEADSFLRAREKSRHSWEVTQVNELLTQMESFEGVFIASTNLMDDLDAAAMRRFDLKIELKPLTNEQRWSLFTRLLKDHGMSYEKVLPFEHQLHQLISITPGDFAVVLRKLVISGREINPEIILDELEKEVAFKPQQMRQRPMGFVV